MIVTMKKATIIVLDSRRSEELTNLKRLGVLHPQIETRRDEEVDGLAEKRELIQHALRELPADATPDAQTAVAEDLTLEGAIHAAHAVHAAVDHHRGRTEVVQRIRDEISRVKPWGEFDPEELERLAEHGVELRLYTMDTKTYRKHTPPGAIPIFRSKHGVGFILAWHNGKQAGDLTPEQAAALAGITPVRMPEIGLEVLRRREEQERAAVEEAKGELEKLAGQRHVLENGLHLVEDLLTDAHMRLGMDTAERVAFVTGFVPESRLEDLKKAAAGNGWGLYIRDPDEDDEVPTQIRNPGMIRIIEPVFNLLGVVPGYRERDISFFFLLFFIVFVGMIIGDAGYGAILLAGAIVGIIRGAARKKIPTAMFLLLVLSISTVAWGGMTGNWFGYEAIGRLVPFRYLVVPALDAFNPASVEAVQAVCFILALTHLTIAHIWNFVREIRRKPAVRAFAQIGWLSLVVALYMLVVSLFVGGTLPSYVIYMIAGGLGFLFIFGSQNADTGFFKGIGRGLGEAFQTLFSIIGAFSDIISYIRLFAVGLASVAIAQAFNGIAAGMGGGIGGTIGGIIVLAFGHTLNLIMGGLAVIVHGVRLNLLEFSGHLGMEWTGVEYAPFSERAKSAEGVQL